MQCRARCRLIAKIARGRRRPGLQLVLALQPYRLLQLCVVVTLTFALHSARHMCGVMSLVQVPRKMCALHTNVLSSHTVHTLSQVAKSPRHCTADTLSVRLLLGLLLTPDIPTAVQCRLSS